MTFICNTGCVIRNDDCNKAFENLKYFKDLYEATKVSKALKKLLSSNFKALFFIFFWKFKFYPTDKGQSAIKNNIFFRNA